MERWRSLLLVQILPKVKRIRGKFSLLCLMR